MTICILSCVQRSSGRVSEITKLGTDWQAQDQAVHAAKDSKGPIAGALAESAPENGDASIKAIAAMAVPQPTQAQETPPKAVAAPQQAAVVPPVVVAKQPAPPPPQQQQHEAGPNADATPPAAAQQITDQPTTAEPATGQAAAEQPAAEQQVARVPIATLQTRTGKAPAAVQTPTGKASVMAGHTQQPDFDQGELDANGLAFPAAAGDALWKCSCEKRI